MFLVVDFPPSCVQYVHRVGRTARAGKTGQALLLLGDFEAFFLKKLGDLPIRNMGQLPPHIVQAEEAVVNRALSFVSLGSRPLLSRSRPMWQRILNIMHHVNMK